MAAIRNKSALTLAFVLVGILFVPVGPVYSSLMADSADEYCETCAGGGYRHHHHHGYYCSSSSDMNQNFLNQMTTASNVGEIKSIQFLGEFNDGSTEQKARHYHHYC